ncbi:MAG: Gfo/Idh/MocA family oxidoreductase [Clostridiales bacterium]|nr:Gfo/Idh/MocA family oxidoreductase [Clostridiales bacterium]
MIQVGIIGCGKIGQVRHLPEYAAREDVRIAALYDVNLERAQALAAQYGAKAYATCEELLADPAIDAVSVCSANASHAEIAIAALEHGKHVLCEKPMATTLADCEAMAEAARRSGKRLMIGQNQRLAGAHVKAKELLDAGAIGSVITFETNFRHGGPETWSVDPGANTWFFDKKRAAMGVMADLGVHKTDLIQHLVGQRITEVTARLTTLDKKFADGTPISVDDNAFCIYRMEGGVCGTMSVSWTDYGAEDNSTVIYGTQGVLRIYDHPEHTLVLEKKGGEVEYFDVDQIQTNDNQTKSGVIDLFVDSILDAHVEGISAESVLPAMRAVFAAIESSETGKTVRIDA